MPQVTFTVSFNEEKHAAVIAWIKRHENRACAIRDACEAAMKRESVSLLDVMLAIEDLKRSGVAVHAGDASDNGDEPAAAVLALDKLGR